MKYGGREPDFVSLDEMTECCSICASATGGNPCYACRKNIRRKYDWRNLYLSISVSPFFWTWDFSWQHYWNALPNLEKEYLK